MKVGFIGLGVMGHGMAANLQKAGHELTIYDLNWQAAAQHLANGAIWAETPRVLAEQCDIVFTSLPGPTQVELVGLGDEGLALALRKGTAWFDLSTNAVDVVHRLHAVLSAKGVEFFDAPVSGGQAGAISGKLSIWVGGDSAAFERYRPVLNAISHQVRYIGEIGAGTVAKLVHNSASATISAALAEVFTMGVKAGVEPLALWEAIREGFLGRLRTFDKLAPRFLSGNYDAATFTLKLSHKDVSLALQLARDISVPMRLCNLAAQDMIEAINRGWGDRDSQVFMLLQQERAGISPLKVPVEQIKAIETKN